MRDFVGVKSHIEPLWEAWCYPRIFLGVGNFSIFDTIDLCSNAFKNVREDLELFAPLPGFLKLFKNWMDTYAKRGWLMIVSIFEWHFYICSWKSAERPEGTFLTNKFWGESHARGRLLFSLSVSCECLIWTGKSSHDIGTRKANIPKAFPWRRMFANLRLFLRHKVPTSLISFPSTFQHLHNSKD